MQEIWEARADSSLDLVAIRYRVMTGVWSSLCFASQRPDPCKVVVRLWAALTAM